MSVDSKTVAAAVEAVRSPAPKKGAQIGTLLSLTLVGLLALMWIALALSTSSFWTANNITNLCRQGAMTANTTRMICIAYTLSAVCAAFVGVLLAARIGIGNATQAEGWELEAIASSIIGGTSLFGAVGRFTDFAWLLYSNDDQQRRQSTERECVLGAYHYRLTDHRDRLLRRPATQETVDSGNRRQNALGRKEFGRKHIWLGEGTTNFCKLRV
jgi:hypothetical protein